MPEIREVKSTVVGRTILTYNAAPVNGEDNGKSLKAHI
jgi:hypothetical protein